MAGDVPTWSLAEHPAGAMDALRVILDALDPLDARLRGVVVEGPGLDVGACVVPLVPDGPNMGRRLAATRPSGPRI
jgi:hypothetical protein